MAVLIETENAIKDFLAGSSSPEEFEAWIISAIDDASDTEREPLWEIRLLLTEYGENLRPLSEAKNRSSKLLHDLTHSQRTDAGT